MSCFDVEDYADLQPHNTFGVKLTARFLARINNTGDLEALLRSPLFYENRYFILGGGSNTLFAEDKFDGIILKNEIKGIELVSEDDQNTVLRVGAGIEWTSLVDYCIQNDLGGLENLSLIPGTVGAAPIQNIGAYGAELSDILLNVEVFDLNTGKSKTMSKEECKLQYRYSIFKQSLKNVMICFITIRTTKALYHQMETGYAAIQQTLQELGVSKPSIRSVSEAVCTLRRRKLPDPKTMGNAGSFFKNLIIDDAMYQSIKRIDANVPLFLKSGGLHIVPAAWLIEQCGWKGKQFGQVEVSASHALVLVNLGAAIGRDIIRLAELIVRDVNTKFGVLLTHEVNIIR
jgi:UDP-N-acetylmuramate dehydrogenase